MTRKTLARLEMGLAVLAMAALASQAVASSEEELIKLYQENRPYARTTRCGHCSLPREHAVAWRPPASNRRSLVSESRLYFGWLPNLLGHR